jgi:hypothetical protein
MPSCRKHTLHEVQNRWRRVFTTVRLVFMRNKQSRTRVVLLSVLFLTTYALHLCVDEAIAQDSQTHQDQTVADAARRIREKKKDLTKQSRVITNEDLDVKHFKAGQEGLNLETSGTKASEASAMAAAPTGQAAVSANKESQPIEAAAKYAEIAKLKQQIAEAEEDLNLRQRELMLDQDTVYSNPNYTDSKAGKAKLDAEQERINRVRQEIKGLQANLAVLQERQASRKQAVRPEGAPQRQ